MKQIYAARHAADAHAVKGFLESQGIRSVVRGEFLAGGLGELPADVCSVWITDGAQFEQANELLIDFLKGTHARKFSGEHWQCPACSEALEGQFTTCWNCGTARPDAA